MFGFRPDGRRVSSIVRITPYLMPMRCDAQVFLQHRVDYELLTRYIAAQAAKGEKITFMQIITAAFVRTVSQHPEINRFILNKQFFARKYDLTDTIYDVRDRMEKVINANRGEDKKNFADKLAKAVLVVPGLATGIVALVRLLDRYGLCPGALLDELPFHTSMYITNNASIGLHHVNHHIYNFGSVTLFFGMGTVEKVAVVEKGEARMKRFLPIGITADERVCSGAHYAAFFGTMSYLLNHPEELEKPPESVRFDEKCEYHVPKVGEQPAKKQKKQQKATVQA